jgi:hypothetical protein
VESCCERGNEPSGSIKCWETTDWLHNLWPLEWYSAPHLVSYRRNKTTARDLHFDSKQRSDLCFCEIKEDS